MKATTLPLRHSVKLSTVRLAVLIPLALAWFTLAPQAEATCQEGCLTNGNTVLGDDALVNNTGADNTAVGSSALEFNTIGGFNTATGFNSLFSNTFGGGNTANGAWALYSNVSGGGNTAIGGGALFGTTGGSQNTATGEDALYSNTIGEFNTATGANALTINTTGSANTAVGWWALGNATGDNNTGVGVNALFVNSGNNNIGLGYFAGYNLSTGSYNIDIGSLGAHGDSNTIRIGTSRTHAKTFIAGISGATVPDGVGVVVGMNGKLGTIVSSKRFKDKIKPMDKASEAILSLKPVTFRYNHDLDPEGIPQFGLVAEDVEKVNPDLVARDEQGKPYTVRYEAVNAMLLNEFIKEHKAALEERRKVEKLEATVTVLVATVKEQASRIQKVSAQLEASKPAPQVVANNQ